MFCIHVCISFCIHFVYIGSNWWSEQFPGEKRFRSIRVLLQELLPGPRSWIFVILSFLVPIFAKHVRFSLVFTTDSWPPGTLQLIHYLPRLASRNEVRLGRSDPGFPRAGEQDDGSLPQTPSNHRNVLQNSVRILERCFPNTTSRRR